MNYHWYNYLGNSNDSSNNGSDTVDEKDLCVKNSVTCSVADEVCDSTDGMCKCGINASCEGNTAAPDCSKDIDNGKCRCGAIAACSGGTPTCNAGTCV